MPAVTSDTGIVNGHIVSSTNNAGNAPSPAPTLTSPPPASSTSSDPITGATGLAGERTPPFRNSPAITGANGPVDIYSGARLFRGNFREYYDPSERQPPASQIYHLDFFYNPASIEIDYASVNMDSYTPIELTQTQLDHQTLANIQNLNSVSWSMIIDRTGVPDSDTPDQAVPEGVLRDVRIFEKILTHGFGGPNQYGYRPLAMTRVRFSRHGGGRQPPLNYIGYISAASVQYTRFNIDMVPTRCEIDITMSITVMNPELWIDSGGEAGYTVKGLGKVGTPLNPYDTPYGTLYLPGQGTRRSFLPGTSSTQINRATPADGSRVAVQGTASTAVNTAEAQQGKPYQFGAAGPSAFDCSGLTKFAWAAAGVDLVHFADGQYRNLPAVGSGSEIAGDLAFFGTTTYVHHVGMVVDPSNHTMFHAPGPNGLAGGPQFGNYASGDLVGFGRPG